MKNNMWSYVLMLFLSTSSVQCASSFTDTSGKFEEKVKLWKLDCVDKTKVDPNLVLSLKSGKWNHKDIGLMKWAMCLLNSANIMSNEGVFKMDEALKLYTKYFDSKYDERKQEPLYGREEEIPVDETDSKVELKRAIIDSCLEGNPTNIKLRKKWWKKPKKPYPFPPTPMHIAWSYLKCINAPNPTNLVIF